MCIPLVQARDDRKLSSRGTNGEGRNWVGLYFRGSADNGGAGVDG